MVDVVIGVIVVGAKVPRAKPLLREKEAQGTGLVYIGRRGAVVIGVSDVLMLKQCARGERYEM